MRCCAKAFSRAAGAERLRGSLTPEGSLRLLPGAFRTDGFFIALIERTCLKASPNFAASLSSLASRSSA